MDGPFEARQKEAEMARKRSFTSQMYRAARLSADARAVRKGRVGHRVVNHAKGRALAKVGFWRWLWK